MFYTKDNDPNIYIEVAPNVTVQIVIPQSEDEMLNLLNWFCRNVPWFAAASLNAEEAA